MLTHVDLCSGIGGFALAAHWNGLTTIGFAEIDPYCQAVLRHHWPETPIHDDVKTLTDADVRRWVAKAHQGRTLHNADNGDFHDGQTLPTGGNITGGTGEVWLVTGGFPCQPFSVAGKQRGKEDHRHLWPDIARLVRTVRPRWVLLENVVGLIRLGLDDVLTDLENEGYATGTAVIPAASVGAPHKRDRVWIIARRRDVVDANLGNRQHPWFAHPSNGGTIPNQTDGQPSGADGAPLAPDSNHDGLPPSQITGGTRPRTGTPSRPAPAQQPAGHDSGAGGDYLLAHAPSREDDGRERGVMAPEERPGRRQHATPCTCGTDVANAEGGGVRRREPSWTCGFPAGGSEAMADPNNPGWLQYRWPIPIQSQQLSIEHGSCTGPADNNDETLGGMGWENDGLSRRLVVEHPVYPTWTRCQGCEDFLCKNCLKHVADCSCESDEQEEPRLDPRWLGDPLFAFGPHWEDGMPRVTDNEEQRVNRLKALGNAIVPQIAYILIASMIEADR